MSTLEQAKGLENHIISYISELEDNDKAVNYVESVENKTADIMTTIQQQGEATPGQLQALTNMRDGLKKWIH